LGAESSLVCSIRAATIRSTITSGMHSTICVGTLIIGRRFVVPRDTKFLTESIVKIGESRRGIDFKLKLDVTVTVDIHESRLNVKSTEINVLCDLDHLTERHTTLLCEKNKIV
jgi:hypothetical protein